MVLLGRSGHTLRSVAGGGFAQDPREALRNVKDLLGTAAFDHVLLFHLDHRTLLMGQSEVQTFPSSLGPELRTELTTIRHETDSPKLCLKSPYGRIIMTTERSEGAVDPSDEVIVAMWTAEVSVRVKAPGTIRALVRPTPLTGLDVFPPGSILIAWSDAQSSLNSVESALDNPALLDGALLGTIENYETSGSENIFDEMGAFASVKYAGRSLLNPAVLPPARGAISYAVLSWLGTQLDPGLFETESWVQPGAEPLSVLVVANPPLEDPDEIALLASLPSELNTDLIARQDSWAAVGKEVTKAALSWAVGKATDAVTDKVAHWHQGMTREQQRDRVQAQERAREQRAMIRHQYRNAQVVDDDILAQRRSDLPSEGLTVDELIQRRVRTLGIDFPLEEK